MKRRAGILPRSFVSGSLSNARCEAASRAARATENGKGSEAVEQGSSKAQGCKAEEIARLAAELETGAPRRFLNAATEGPARPRLPNDVFSCRMKRPSTARGMLGRLPYRLKFNEQAAEREP